MARDPVCYCEVDEEGAEFKTKHEGKTYYFCTAGCKAKFESDPDKWSKVRTRVNVDAVQ